MKAALFLLLAASTTAQFVDYCLRGEDCTTDDKCQANGRFPDAFCCDYTCTIPEPLRRGEACLGKRETDADKCLSRCARGYCDEGVCISPVGEENFRCSCQSNLDCRPGLFCNKDKGECYQSSNVFNGGLCFEDSNCLSNYCFSDKTSVDHGTCAPAPEHAVCNFGTVDAFNSWNLICKKPFTCNLANRCSQLASGNGACELAQCAEGQYCNRGETGAYTCVAANILEANDACGTVPIWHDDLGDGACGGGLLCIEGACGIAPGLDSNCTSRCTGALLCTPHQGRDSDWNVCRHPESVFLDGKCSATEQCTSGLTCDYSSGNSVWGTCLDLDRPLNADCSQPWECDESASLRCDRSKCVKLRSKDLGAACDQTDVCKLNSKCVAPDENSTSVCTAFTDCLDEVYGCGLLADGSASECQCDGKCAAAAPVPCEDDFSPETALVYALLGSQMDIGALPEAMKTEIVTALCCALCPKNSGMGVTNSIGFGFGSRLDCHAKTVHPAETLCDESVEEETYVFNCDGPGKPESAASALAAPFSLLVTLLSLLALV